jgi:hypothetical protein
MQLTVTIPTRAHVINGGFVVTIARTGTEWLKAQLGEEAPAKYLVARSVEGVLNAI